MSGSSLGKFLFILALVDPCFAQSGVTFSVGGGRTTPLQDAGERLDAGFSLAAGVAYHPVKSFGVLGEFGYYRSKLNPVSLRNIGAAEGNGRIISATLNPMFHFLRDGPLDLYAIGGGGYYRRTIEFTAPSAVRASSYDPFYGINYPVFVPTTSLLGSFSQDAGGWNGGIGMALRLGAKTKTTVFAESRYHYIYTTPVRTTMLPITVGIRF